VGSAASGEPGGRTAAGGPRLVTLALLVGTLTWIAHSPVLDAQAHCFDENEFLTSNELVSNPSWHSVSRFVGEVLEPSTVAGYYAPVTMVSLMLDVAMGGRPDDLTAFHRTNLLLHAANAVAIVLLLGALLRSPEAAALAGALFVAHPLSVEPVAWIVERKTLLATFFALLALIAYVRSVARNARGTRWLALGCFTLACLAKPTAVVLPAVMLVLDAWPLGRLDRETVAERIREKAAFILMAIAFAAVTLVSHDRTAGVDAPGGGGLTSLLTAVHLVAFYLGKVVWPAALSPVYLLPEPLALSNPRILLDLAVVSLLLVGAVVLAMRGVQAPLAGLAILVAGLAPTLGGLRYSWVTASDKYLYLPALGLALIVGWAIDRLWARGSGGVSLLRGGIVAVALMLLAVEIAATRNQLALWQSTETLYGHMLEQTPDVGLLYANLGQTHWQRGRVEPARLAFERAIELDAEDAQSHNNLGVLFWATGQPERARMHLQRAIGADPSLAAPHRNLGIALNGFGQFEAARQRFERALAIDEGDAQAHCGLALSLGRLRRSDEARAHLERSLAITPGCALPPGLVN